MLLQNLECEAMTDGREIALIHGLTLPGRSPVAVGKCLRRMVRDHRRGESDRLLEGAIRTGGTPRPDPCVFGSNSEARRDLRQS